MALFPMTTRMTVLKVAVLAALSVTVYLAVMNNTGRLTANRGTGWDGAAYVAMLQGRLIDQQTNERLRPLIVLLNRPLYLLSDRSVAGAIDAFVSMNVLYMFWLSAALMLLASAYGASGMAQLFIAVNLPLCVATSKYFAYYPTLIDLGAYAVIATALYVVVRGTPRAAALAAVLAAVSREFGLMVAIFGMHREARLTRKPLRAAAIYAPAVVAWLALRYVVSRYPGALLQASNFANNLELWHDQQFVAFFLYFCVSVFGGVSMMVAARPAQCFRLLRREPEWLTFALPLVAVTTVGNNDMWRYLAYVLPVVVVLVAACDTEWTNALRGWMFSIATIATLVTQRPFERIRLDTYYSHWFPYYVIPSAAPDDLERLWLYWGRMMIVTAIAIWLMAVPETPRRIARAARRAEPVEADETAMRATL